MSADNVAEWIPASSVQYKTLLMIYEHHTNIVASCHARCFFFTLPKLSTLFALMLREDSPTSSARKTSTGEKCCLFNGVSLILKKQHFFGARSNLSCRHRSGNKCLITLPFMFDVSMFRGNVEERVYKYFFTRLSSLIRRCKTGTFRLDLRWTTPDALTGYLRLACMIQQKLIKVEFIRVFRGKHSVAGIASFCRCGEFTFLAFLIAANNHGNNHSLFFIKAW